MTSTMVVMICRNVSKLVGGEYMEAGMYHCDYADDSHYDAGYGGDDGFDGSADC